MAFELDDIQVSTLKIINTVSFGKESIINVSRKFLKRPKNQFVTAKNNGRETN